MYDNSKLFVPRAELKMTVIDGLVDYVNSDSLAVMQMYDPYVINVSEIYNHHNQVVVFLGPGEYHHDSWLDDIFCRSKNYHKQHGVLKNYYIMIHRHDYPESIKQNYSDYFITSYP